MIFHNHEVAGARIAEKICERLKFSKKEKDKVVMLIRWHMFSVNENQTDAAIRRFIRKVGVENVKDMMDLQSRRQARRRNPNGGKLEIKIIQGENRRAVKAGAVFD